ncbi:hypothetical protein NA57DRAFT_81140 [Rhizodiscina lignyota]|uniref:Uncharacterized protein n=1 Tax=Rhizodiscina lignyota TaxID=1504668 RepID=A0A9P4M1M8_9PEZI|nr:hypothetical protein NA57DRAFT_81140 [Rhizodiscina lignyota]
MADTHRYIINFFEKKPEPDDQKIRIIVPFNPSAPVHDLVREIKFRAVEQGTMKMRHCLTLYLNTFDGPSMYNRDTLSTVVLDPAKEEIWAYIARNCPLARLAMSPYATRPCSPHHHGGEVRADGKNRSFITGSLYVAYDEALIDLYIEETPPDILDGVLTYIEREITLDPFLEHLGLKGKTGVIIRNWIGYHLLHLKRYWILDFLPRVFALKDDLEARKPDLPDMTDDEIVEFMAEHGFHGGLLNIFKRVEKAEVESTEDAGNIQDTDDAKELENNLKANKKRDKKEREKKGRKGKKAQTAHHVKL